MKDIKKLQAQLKKGEITAAQYQAEIKKLLETEVIDQEDYDEAKDYDPTADEKIYTQADVDSFIAKKATQQLRKICKEAGIELDGVGNKDLVAHVTGLLKAEPGTTGKGKADDAETAKLQKKAARVDTLIGQLKDVNIELAVLKALASGDYKGVNPVQVLRAVKLDYKDDIEVDEDGDTIKVDRRSVEATLKTIKKAEPALFKAPVSDDQEEETDEIDGQEENSQQSTTFRGKGPNSNTKPVKKDLDADKKKALEIMGISTETKK